MTSPPVAEVDLTTTIADAVFASPVFTASGCGGMGRELTPYGDLDTIGAFVTPSVTRDAEPGWPLPRLAETPSGLVSAVGSPGPGIDGFLATDLPWLLQRDIRTIVSISGTTLGEYAELARRVGSTPGIAGIEVHFPGRPSVKHAARAIGVVRRDAAAGVPVFAKLWPACGERADLAATLLQVGADAVVVTGTVPGVVLDPISLRPLLGGGIDGPSEGACELSGPAMLAAGLHAVWEVRRGLPNATIIGGGGIRTGTDALHYLAVGANAVQVGSAILTDPAAPTRVVAELRAELAHRGLSTPADLRGVAHRPLT